jgi:hypothetical protein
VALRGSIDVLTHRRIVGWAWDPDAPDVPVIVLIGIMGRLLGRCQADLFREDLATEGFGTGRCGFALELPAGVLALGQGYEIIVRREGDGAHLPGSPYVLEPAIRVVREE